MRDILARALRIHIIQSPIVRRSDTVRMELVERYNGLIRERDQFRTIANEAAAIADDCEKAAHALEASLVEFQLMQSVDSLTEIALFEDAS